MYAHVRECTSRQVECAHNPDKALQLCVLLIWALHLLREGRHVLCFDVTVLGAFARVRRALGRVHLLDHGNGLASACDEQSKVVVVVLAILELERWPSPSSPSSV